MDKKEKTIPVYELKVNLCNSQICDGTGVKFVSLVENPALNIDFVQFSSEENQKNFTFKTYDASKKCLIGPIMIPGKEIYRKNIETGEEYFVVFSEESVANCQKNFIANKYQDQIDTEHKNEKVPGAMLLENWIIENPEKDKSAAFGFNLPKGTWMGTTFISDEETWKNYILTGKVKGFSAEVGVDFGAKVADIEIKNYHNQEQKFSSEEENILEMIAQILTDKNENF